MDKDDDPWEIIGVSRDASDAEIKKAFRKGALLYHPDRQDNEEDRAAAQDIFSKYSEAYETLTDPVKRSDWKLAEEKRLSKRLKHPPSAPASPAQTPKATATPKFKRPVTSPVPKMPKGVSSSPTRRHASAGPGVGSGLPKSPQSVPIKKRSVNLATMSPPLSRGSVRPAGTTAPPMSPPLSRGKDRPTATAAPPMSPPLSRAGNNTARPKTPTSPATPPLARNGGQTPKKARNPNGTSGGRPAGSPPGPPPLGRGGQTPRKAGGPDGTPVRKGPPRKFRDPFAIFDDVMKEEYGNDYKDKEESGWKASLGVPGLAKMNPFKKKTESARKEFKKLDVNKDKTLSKDELSKYIESRSDLWETLANGLDLPMKKCVEVATEVAFWLAFGEGKARPKFNELRKRHELSEAEFKYFHKNFVMDEKGSHEFFLRTLFSVFDLNGDGVLNARELDKFLDIFYQAKDVFTGNMRLPDKRTLNNIIRRRLDQNGDGVLNFLEVRDLLEVAAVVTTDTAKKS